MAQHLFNFSQFGDDAANHVLVHFKKNPFRLHFASWLVAALPLSLLMITNFSTVSVMAFGITAIVVCTILSVMTYPLSGHYSFTIVGALFGAAMLPLGELFGVFGPINSQVIQASLLVGAIIGSTSLIWRIPLHIFGAVRKT